MATSTWVLSTAINASTSTMQAIISTNGSMANVSTTPTWTPPQPPRFHTFPSVYDPVSSPPVSSPSPLHQQRQYLQQQLGSVVVPTPLLPAGLSTVLLDFFIGLFLVTFLTGLVTNTLLVIALVRRKRDATPSDLIVSNMHFCLYYLFLDSLVMFHKLFFIRNSNPIEYFAFYISDPFTHCAMPYLFTVFSMGFFGCLTLLSCVLYATCHRQPAFARLTNMRYISLALIFIWTFCLLANVHFLLTQCNDFDLQYFIEYQKKVWLKLVIIDGFSFMICAFMLASAISYVTRSDHPDRLLLRQEALGYTLVLVAYIAPQVVDALCASFEGFRLAATSHRVVTVTVRESAYCLIPVILANFRPQSRADWHDLVDAMRSFCSRNWSRISAPCVRWCQNSSYVLAPNSGNSLITAAHRPSNNSNGASNGQINSGFVQGLLPHSASRLLGLNGHGRLNIVDDDQIQILSICQESQNGFEDGSL